MRNHILKVVVPVLLTATALFGAGSVAVTPGSNETTALGGTRQYNAAVTGLSSTAVTWSVSGPGSIDPMMGLYSAPPVGSISVPATVTVTATAVADPTAKASVTLTLLNPGASLTSASPNTFAAGNFTLTLTGNGFQQGAQALILTSSGFTPFTTTYKSATQLGVSGAIYTNGNTYITVKNPNSMNSNFLSLTVNYAAPNTLTVSPSPAVVPVGMTQAFTALNNSSPTSASWSVTGGGTITSAGVYKIGRAHV